MNQMPDDPHDLSERELEVLELVATGASNRQVAQQLSISQNTVKVHLRNIFNKIGAASRTEAAMYAVRIGLIQPAPETATAESGGNAAAADVPAWLAWSRRPWARWAALALFLLLALAAVVVVQLLSGATPAAGPAPEALPTLPPRWLERPALSAPRAGLAAAAYENLVYAIAGETPQGVVGTVARFNPAEDRWETGLADKPTPVADVRAAVVGGRIYVPGGRLAGGATTDVLEVYDPGEDRWSKGAPLPVPLSGYALVAFEGRLYLFGGREGDRTLDLTLRYDPALDAWEELPPMPSARAFAGAAVAGDGIYVIGGHDGAGPLDLNVEFLPAELEGGDPWRAKAPMPQARSGMGVAGIAGIIHVIGGESADPELPSLKYFPVEDLWEAFEASELPDWTGMGLVAVDTSLHAVGGLGDLGPTAAHQTYQAIYTIAIPVVR